MKKRSTLKLMFCAIAGATMVTSCGTTPTESSFVAKDSYSIGVIQLVQHVALDAATQGFKDALSEEMAAAGKTVTFDVKVASGAATECASIASTFVSNKVDLILGNATAALQAAYQATATIPVLGTSITDYGTALGVSNWTGVSGTNVSGTTDLAPLDQQAEEMVKLFKLDANSNVALLYCSAEANSKYQVTELAKYLTAKGVKSTEFAFTDSNDITNVCNDIVAKNATAVYIPTDNTAASATTTINNAFYGKVPVYTGEEGICQGCGVATLSISYESLGRKTGQMAAQILLQGADIKTMAVQTADTVTKEYVKEYADMFNITIPDDYVAILHQ